MVGVDKGEEEAVLAEPVQGPGERERDAEDFVTVHVSDPVVAADTEMLDANRKRSDRDAILNLKDQAPSDLNDNHVAIVPVGVNLVSPPQSGTLKGPRLVKARMEQVLLQNEFWRAPVTGASGPNECPSLELSRRWQTCDNSRALQYGEAVCPLDSLNLRNPDRGISSREFV